jgi:formylglycine-generating enzyme required for sulfatase activity
MVKYTSRLFRDSTLVVMMSLGLWTGYSVAIVRADNHPVSTPESVYVPAGPFITGSNRAERELAYGLDEAAYGHSRTRANKWYENERHIKTLSTQAYAISRTPITNRQYAAFIKDTGHRVPQVDRQTWESYGLIHPFERTRRFVWLNGEFPAGRGEHPVVLVSYASALAYARWLSQVTGDQWRLPSEEEWEKAARGTTGQTYPWGKEFDPQRLNSHDLGPFDTTPVGQFPQGDSPYGLRDGAGQVFEWTSSTYSTGRYVVKGGSWDDKGCGICRPAARHTRPGALKHILIGFRVVRIIQ